MDTRRDELIDFLTRFWRSACDASAEVDEGLGSYLDALWEHRTAFVQTDDLPARLSDTKFTAAFSPSRRAVWMNGKAIKALLRTPEPFYDTKVVAKRVNELLDRDEWHTLLGQHPNGIPSGSVLVHGILDADLWLGARTEAEIRATCRSDPQTFGLRSETRLGSLLRALNREQRAELLKLPPVPPNIVLLSGSKIVRQENLSFAYELGFAFGETELVLLNGGLATVDGNRNAIDVLVVNGLREQLQDEQREKQRILTLLPTRETDGQTRHPYGTQEPESEADTAERRSKMVKRASMVVMFDGGEGSKYVAAEAFTRETPLLPVAGISFSNSAAHNYWLHHQDSVIKHFGLTENEVAQLAAPATTTAQIRNLARLVVKLLRRRAFSSQSAHLE